MERDVAVAVESRDLASPVSTQRPFAPFLHIMLREFGS